MRFNLIEKLGMALVALAVIGGLSGIAIDSCASAPEPVTAVFEAANTVSPKHFVAKTIAVECGPLTMNNDAEAIEDVKALATRDIGGLFGNEAYITDINIYITPDCNGQELANALVRRNARVLLGNAEGGYMLVAPVSKDEAYWLIATDNVLIIIDLSKKPRA